MLLEEGGLCNIHGGVFWVVQLLLTSIYYPCLFPFTGFRAAWCFFFELPDSKCLLDTSSRTRSTRLSLIPWNNSHLEMRWSDTLPSITLRKNDPSVFFTVCCADLRLGKKRAQYWICCLYQQIPWRSLISASHVMLRRWLRRRKKAQIHSSVIAAYLLFWGVYWGSLSPKCFSVGCRTWDMWRD